MNTYFEPDPVLGTEDASMTQFLSQWKLESSKRQILRKLITQKFKYNCGKHNTNILYKCAMTVYNNRSALPSHWTLNFVKIMYNLDCKIQ